jgi:hypothetical protein
VILARPLARVYGVVRAVPVGRGGVRGFAHTSLNILPASRPRFCVRPLGTAIAFSSPTTPSVHTGELTRYMVVISPA